MLIEDLYKAISRNKRFFEKALALEKEIEGLSYISSAAVASTLICPRAASYRASEEEVYVFARAFRDRVKYAVMLGIADAKQVDLFTRRALRGEGDAMRSLLRIGADIGPDDIGPILPRLKEEFETARSVSRKVVVTAARGLVREAAVYVKYAEPYPYVGMGHRYRDEVFYAVAGVGADHVYLFRIARDMERAKRMALVEGDVAAAALKRPTIKLHIYVPGQSIRSLFEKAADPTPKYKALIEGECRPGPACRTCKYRNSCECVGDIPRRRHAGS